MSAKRLRAYEKYEIAFRLRAPDLIQRWNLVYNSSKKRTRANHERRVQFSSVVEFQHNAKKIRPEKEKTRTTIQI
jgi:hypothetical protein